MRRRTLTALLSLALLAMPGAASAGHYGPADTRAALDAVGAGPRQRCTVAYETGFTWKAHIVGRAGELGPAQLHPRGLLLAFRQWGGTDPHNPYESMRFMRWAFLNGLIEHWSPIKLGLCP